ncbi:MAG TPA: CehA/McbA family metallohydrolase [Bryobacteraceae bacterium]|nr:CehA/McbA family metallohydrolase [Bryobacteraceae bacterium]
MTRFAASALLLATFVTAQPAGRYAAARTGGTYLHNYYLPPAPSTTPWAPAWAPDGRTIAVAMYGSIWRVDPNTGVATEITYNRHYHSSPAWSPDGRWLVYTGDDNHQRIQLEILNVETGEITALTDDAHVYADPVFSPDGKYLAYVSTRPSGYFNVYVRAIRNGRWAGEEVAVTRDHRYPRSRLYVGEWDMHIEPAWLRSGSELLMVSNRGVPQGSGALWRVPVEPGGMEKANKILDEQSLFRTRPDVSPDGRRFIYSSSGGGTDQFHHLYVLPVDGGYPYKMTFGDHEDFHPRWSPDGEQIAYISNEGGRPQLVILETYGGRKKKVSLADLKWKRPMVKVSVTIVDGQTGKPMHGRVQGVASDGKFYAPRDAYARVGGTSGHAFHTAGNHEVFVPPGKLKVQVTRGFEYWPREAEVDVTAAQKHVVTITLTRMTDMRAKGWYNGSTHTHMNYGGNLRNTLENLMFMARSEGQDIVNELVANKENRVFDYQYFESGGGEHSVSRSDAQTRLLVGEEYRPPFYGHVFLLGLAEHLISPFLTGYEGTGVESLYPSNTDIFRKALAQNAVTGYVHAFSGESDPLERDLGVAKAFPVDAALKTVQCLEWSTASRAQLKVWHHALNNDLRVTPTGGEDSISNLHIGKLIGSVRTYAYLGSDFSITAWLEALRQGRTFFTSGPLLEFRIDGKVPGEEIRLSSGGGTVALEAQVKSIAPLSQVVIHRNGAPWKQLALHADAKSASLRTSFPVTESGWYSLYAEGPRTEYLDTNYVQAATNAIRVYVGDQPIRNKDSAEYFMRWIDKLQAMAEAWPWWRSDKEKAHVFAQFREARQTYARFAAEAGARRHRAPGYSGASEVKQPR